MKNKHKHIHITFLNGIQKYSFLTNWRKDGTLLCLIEEVKSTIAMLDLYTFMLSIFFIENDSISFL